MSPELNDDQFDAPLGLGFYASILVMFVLSPFIVVWSWLADRIRR